MDKIIW